LKGTIQYVIGGIKPSSIHIVVRVKLYLEVFVLHWPTEVGIPDIGFGISKHAILPQTRTTVLNIVKLEVVKGTEQCGIL
jgi:hypothetical protein